MMIQKRMGWYIHIVALIGIFVTSTRVCCAAEIDNTESSAQAQQLTDMVYSNYIASLLKCVQHLQLILHLKSKTFSAAVEKIEDPSKKELAKQHCSELGEVADRLNKKCHNLLHNNDASQVWEITAGILRLYKATGLGLKGDFLRERPANEPAVTEFDITTMSVSNVIKSDEVAYRKKLKQSLPGDKSLLKELFKEFKELGIIIKDKGIAQLLPEEQQILLNNIAKCSTKLKEFQQEVNGSLRDFGLTTAQKKARWRHEKFEPLYREWHMNSTFRTMVVGVTMGIAVTGCGAIGWWVYGLGPTFGKLLAATSTGSLFIGGHALAGVGRRAGDHITDGTIELIHDAWNGVIEYNAKKGKIGEFENIIYHNRKTGTVIKKIIPQDSAYDRTIIGNEFDEQLQLLDDMLAVRSTDDEIAQESVLTGRTKGVIICGRPGEGKSHSTKWLMNKTAQKASLHGIPVYHALFTIEAIRQNEVEQVAEWFKDKKALTFFDLGELHHIVAVPKEQDKDKSAYRNVLNFTENLALDSNTYMALTTTNKPEAAEDLSRIGRNKVVYKRPPSSDERKQFLNKCFTGLDVSYGEQHVNRMVTLTENGTMAQLENIYRELKAEKNKNHRVYRKNTTLTPAFIEHIVLREIHNLQPTGITSSHANKESCAIHVAGKLLVALSPTSHENVKDSFTEGTSIALVSIQDFGHKSKPDLIAPDEILPGKLIYASSALQQTKEDQVRIAVAGYIAQELIIKDPRKHNFKLADIDRKEAFKICEAHMQKYQDSKDMTERQRTEFAQLVEIEVKKVEEETRKKLNASLSLLRETANHILQRGEIRDLEYFELQKKFGRKQEKPH